MARILPDALGCRELKGASQCRGRDARSDSTSSRTRCSRSEAGFLVTKDFILKTCLHFSQATFGSLSHITSFPHAHIRPLEPGASPTLRTQRSSGVCTGCTYHRIHRDDKEPTCAIRIILRKVWRSTRRGGWSLEGSSACCSLPAR